MTAHCLPSSCSDTSPVHLQQSLLVEQEHAEWFLAERVVPGTEIHKDRDVTWVVHTGAAWRNAASWSGSLHPLQHVASTLSSAIPGHRRGMALWISPSATPSNITDLLTARRLRCQKYYPAMIRDLADRAPSFQQPKELVIRRVIDPTEFRNTAHPAIGPLTTPLRRNAFERMRALLSQPSARTRLRSVAERNAGRCHRGLRGLQERRHSRPHSDRALPGAGHRLGPDRACLHRCSRSGCKAHRTACIHRGSAAVCAQGIP